MWRAVSWWRHQMETFSALLAICTGNSPVIGEFLAQRPVARSFDIFFDLCLHKCLSKQSWGWWFETPSRPLWRHSNVPWCHQTCVRVSVRCHWAREYIDDTVSSHVAYGVANAITINHNGRDNVSIPQPHECLLNRTVYSDADQRKHQSSASLTLVVRGIHRGTVNSPHKWPVTWKMFPFDDVIMIWSKRCGH